MKTPDLKKLVVSSHRRISLQGLRDQRPLPRRCLYCQPGNLCLTDRPGFQPVKQVVLLLDELVVFLQASRLDGGLQALLALLRTVAPRVSYLCIKSVAETAALTAPLPCLHRCLNQARLGHDSSSSSYYYYYYYQIFCCCSCCC